jgi:hypothetical protein
MVGIACTWNFAAVCGFSSTFSFSTFRRPARSAAILSITGATARQGPHQGAQKSTSTGIGDLSTSCAQFASVPFTGSEGNSGFLQLPQLGTLFVGLAASRFSLPQKEQRVTGVCDAFGACAPWTSP